MGRGYTQSQWVRKAANVTKAMWHGDLREYDAIPEVVGLRFGLYQARRWRPVVGKTALRAC